MAYGLNKSKLVIFEPEAFIGTWNNPQLIGDAVNWEDRFLSPVRLGYQARGTTVIDLSDTRAEPLTSTPAYLLVSDLTRRMFSFTMANFQMAADWFELLFGLQVVRNVASVGVNGAQVWNIAFVGHDEPLRAEVSVLLRGKTREGKELSFAHWKSIVTSKDKKFTYSGDNHITVNLEFTATVDEQFAQIGANANVRDFGAIFERVS